MHELGIACEIVSAALAEAKKHGGEQVTAVKVRVGVLRGIVPGTLAFLFGHAARGTPAERAAFEVEEEPLRIECPVCGITESGAFTVACPVCGGEATRIEGGDSLAIVSLEIEI